MLNHPIAGLTNASEWRGQELREEVAQLRLVKLASAPLTMRAEAPMPPPTRRWPVLVTLWLLAHARRRFSITRQVKRWRLAADERLARLSARARSGAEHRTGLVSEHGPM